MNPDDDFEVPARPQTDEEFANLPILTLPLDRTDSAESPPVVAPVEGNASPNAQAEGDAGDDTGADSPADDSDADDDDFADVSREGDPIGVVVPGDRDGLASLVVRSINGADHAEYRPEYVDLIKQRQHLAGIPVDGVVRGETWGLVLRELRHGAMGQEVRIVRGLLGLDEDGIFDETVEQALQHRFGDSQVVVDRQVWLELIAYPGPEQNRA